MERTARGELPNRRLLCCNKHTTHSLPYSPTHSHTKYDDKIINDYNFMLYKQTTLNFFLWILRNLYYRGLLTSDNIGLPFFFSKYDPCYVAGLTDNTNDGQYRNGMRYRLAEWVAVGTTLMNQPSISLRSADKLHRVGKENISTVRTGGPCLGP